VKHLPVGAAARRRLIGGGSCRAVRALVGMGGSAASMVIVVGLLAGACSSSASPASSSGSANTTAVADVTSSWSMVDINTGAITPLPASSATSGPFYAVSPDRTKVAYNACCDWATPVLMANLDGTHVHQISAPGWDGVGEQWSPNGSLLVYQQRDSSDHLGNLFVQNLATGQRTRVTNLDQTQEWGWWFTFPSFSSDGRSILFQLPRGHLPNNDNRIWNLWSVPVAGGKPTLVQRNAGWGGYSPDGKRLAYLSPVRRDFDGAGLWIRSVHGGTPQALVHGGSLGWLRWSPDGTRIAYTDGSAIYVVDAATGSTRKVGHGGNPEWLDDHTLILSSS
jgi:Tol biopolymer transport system component